MILKIIDKISDYIPLCVMVFTGVITFISDSLWWRNNMFIIQCITGYSIIFGLRELYLSLKYTKKLIVEIPLITLVLASIFMILYHPTTWEDYQNLWMWDFTFMCMMFVSLIIIVLFNLHKKLKRDLF